MKEFIGPDREHLDFEEGEALAAPFQEIMGTIFASDYAALGGLRHSFSEQAAASLKENRPLIPDPTDRTMALMDNVEVVLLGYPSFKELSTEKRLLLLNQIVSLMEADEKAGGSDD